MKKILLDGKKPYFKANLHCHSTISDGAKTPEELKELYKSHGYSVLAYTDHNVMIDHSDLTDGEFIALNGYELDINDSHPCASGETKTCHLCYVALQPDNLTQVCFHRTDYAWGNQLKYKPAVKFDESKPDFIRNYTPECISEMIAEGRRNGYFVTYNHPSWSHETINEYGKYIGMNAMEICNFGCVESGYADYNEKEYDDILRGGQKIYCIATDDNHNRRNDSFGGFTVINSDKLEYTAITDALEHGKFYASEGPQIFDVWYEDGKIGITCSAAATIKIGTARRRCDAVHAANQSEALTSAVFDVKEGDKYVRLTVIDFGGKHANTNAYFLEDLCSKGAAL